MTNPTPEPEHFQDDAASSSDEIPPIEDASSEDIYVHRDADAESVLAEDDPALLEPDTRALNDESVETAAAAGEPRAVGHVASAADESDAFVDAAAGVTAAEEAGADRPADWSNEHSSQRLVGELTRIESQVRDLLADVDPKRKRKLAGTRRWRELEDDLASWRFSDRVNEETITELLRLIARRHFLYGRLRFLSSTRPTWNS